MKKIMIVVLLFVVCLGFILGTTDILSIIDQPTVEKTVTLKPISCIGCKLYSKGGKNYQVLTDNKSSSYVYWYKTGYSRKDTYGFSKPLKVVDYDIKAVELKITAMDTYGDYPCVVKTGINIDDKWIIKGQHNYIAEGWNQYSYIINNKEWSWDDFNDIEGSLDIYNGGGGTGEIRVASFNINIIYEVPLYTLNIEKNDGGSYTVSPLKDIYEDNTEITLKAKSDDGYSFKQWKINNQIYETSEVTIVIKQDTDVELSFESIPSDVPDDTDDEDPTPEPEPPSGGGGDDNPDTDPSPTPERTIWTDITDFFNGIWNFLFGWI